MKKFITVTTIGMAGISLYYPSLGARAAGHRVTRSERTEIHRERCAALPLRTTQSVRSMPDFDAELEALANSITPEQKASILDHVPVPIKALCSKMLFYAIRMRMNFNDVVKRLRSRLGQQKQS